MKILFFGDVANTGFGTVTRDLGRALLNRGADVRFVSQNELGDLEEPFRSRTVDLALLIQSADGVEGIQTFIPDLLSGIAPLVTLANGEPWGAWKPDCAIVLGDFAAARLFCRPYLEAFKKLPTFHYVPIEGTDLPPSWADLWKVLTPVAMSGFGQREIAKITGTLPPLAYHGVDTEVFHPVSPTNPIKLNNPRTGEHVTTLQSKEMCKAFFNADPRERIVFRADSNWPRKGYPGLLRAMVPVLLERPDVRLVLHTMAEGRGGTLYDSISKMPVQVQAQVSVTNIRGGVPRDALVAMYNAADLYVSTSAEGFGLTIAEAIACGVPAVGLDYSAVPEVIGPAGVVVPVGGLYDNEYDHYWAVPDEKKFGETVAYLLDHPARRRMLGQQGPRHVAENFRWDLAAKVFTSALEPAVMAA